MSEMERTQRVDCLDGLRGLAAMWVVIGHAMILTGWHKPVLGDPDLGVDLFIMLSGFLMVFQYRLREGREDWARPRVWASFWLRRFFRLAPLFYVALVLALVFGGALYADRSLIDAQLGHAPQDAGRYTDTGLVNILLHLSFLFGLSPHYAFRTALPDWSLGLEMQFYATFPFLMLAIRRWGWAAGAAGIAILFGLAGYAAKGAGFPMPSFLPLKMHVFLAGMLLAAAMGRPGHAALPFVAATLLLMLVPLGGEQGMLRMAARLGIALGFAAVILWPAARPVAVLLARRPFRWLGDVSYGVYLIHLLVMQPVVAMLFRADVGSAPLRFIAAVVIVAPLSCIVAAMGYRWIEQPGQRLGKRVIDRIGLGRGAGKGTAAEAIAAP